MEQKKLSRPNKLGELFLFQISYVLPREYGGRHLLEACPRHVSVHALLAECDSIAAAPCGKICGFNPRTPCGVRQAGSAALSIIIMFQSTHSLRSATLNIWLTAANTLFQSTHSLRSATLSQAAVLARWMFQSTHSLRSATPASSSIKQSGSVSIHALLAECDILLMQGLMDSEGFNPRTPCGVRLSGNKRMWPRLQFQSTHSLRSATAPDLIHCYSTKQIILCANLPKKTVIARLLFLSIYLSIFYSQCITPIADLPGNSYELEVGAQAMFNSL